MPKWAGKWIGGRYYLDASGKTVYFIERRGRTVRLRTHDEQLALGDLSRFLDDPDAFCLPPAADRLPVRITLDRLNLYMDSIRGAVSEHRKARKRHLIAWANLNLDLRTADRKALRGALASFDGGHNGRAESLNAFARFLVREEDLPAWNPLVSMVASEQTRALREAYTVEQLQVCYQRLPTPRMKDFFLLRCATGMHHTEIAQLVKAPLYHGPLPDKGVGIRTLGGEHQIQGVLQVMHKSRHRHRQSVDAACLVAALRLRASVPRRGSVWKALDPIVPSNLRHTFVTLAGEFGVEVRWTEAGVDRARIAQAVGHRAGSTMTADRYDKLQVPPMIRLPLGFG